MSSFDISNFVKEMFVIFDAFRVTIFKSILY